MTRTITHMAPSIGETLLIIPMRVRQKLSGVPSTPADASIETDFERPITPTSGASSPTNEPPEFVSRPRDLSDDDEDDYNQQRSGGIPRKKGGYDSRIEQILYENPDLQIIITDAGKSHESGGSYIVYTIRTGVCFS